MKLTRDEAHLVLAAIRVQSYLLERSPTPAEVADLLNRSETELRLQLNFLQELGAADLVDSAFASHVEIRDHLKVETLTASEGPALSEDLKAFDREQEAEAERMANLFESGEQARQQDEKMNRMDDELRDFKNRKPRNPFGDDD